MVSTAIILAGGLGTRLRSAVPDLPKPMAPVAGEPFLAHQMRFWIAQGITRFVLSVGYRHEAIVAHFGRRFEGASVEYVVETRPLGTGGGLLLAAQCVAAVQQTLLLNGDTYFDVPLRALEAAARQQRADWTFSLFESHDPARYMGVGVSAEGRITALRDPSAPLANGGAYLFRPAAVAALGFKPGDALSLENDLFARAFAAGQRFAALRCDGAFIDIGVPHDFHRAAAVIVPARAPEPAHALAG